MTSPSSPAEPRRGRRAALWALQIGLTALVTALILRAVGLGVDELAALDPGSVAWRWSVLALSCVALLGGYVASALVWRRMVVDLGGPRLPLRAAAEVYLVANLGRYLPGKLWQVAGLAALASGRGVSGAVATAAALLGQALALGGATLIGAAALTSGVGPSPFWKGALLAGVAAMVVAIVIPPVRERGVALWFRLARQREAPRRTSTGQVLGWLALYTLNWALYAVAFVLLVRGMGFAAPAVPTGSSFAAAYVLGYAAVFAPAGLGVREGFIVLFLSPSIGVGGATLVSVVARLWTTVVEVAPAAALWAFRFVAADGKRTPA